MILECCGCDVASLIPVETTCKKGPVYSGMMRCQAFTCCSAIIKIWEHPKCDCLEPKGTLPAETSWRNAALEGTNGSHISVAVRRDISPKNYLEHPAREAQ